MWGTALGVWVQVPTGGSRRATSSAGAREPTAARRGADPVRRRSRRSQSGWERALGQRAPDLAPPRGWKGTAVRDTELMDRALTLAEGARRRTPPNPWVGCVLVADGTVVGEGATHPPGGPHAEAAAVAAAGDRAAGATTAYVTLEPCAHQGRTGPCVDALLAAGVRRVVVALEDPDPHVAGRGLAALRAAGVDVEVGVGAAEVRRSLAPYLHQRRTGRAFCVAKTASSVDGRSAAPDGTSRWITGAGRPRRRAHPARRLAGGRGRRRHRDRRPARAHRARHRAAPPTPPLRVLLDARGPRPGHRPALRPRARARRSSSPPPPRPPTPPTSGAPTAPRSRSSTPPRPASTCARRSPSSPATASSRRSSRAARGCTARSGGPGSSTGSSSTSAPPCSATRPARRSTRPDRRRSPTPSGGPSSTSPRSTATCASPTNRPGPADVHRHRRGARQVRVAPTGQPARLVVTADATRADATIGASIAVNGVCLTVVDPRRRRLRLRRRPRDPHPQHPRRPAGRRPGEPRAAGAPHRPARRPPRAGPRRRGRHRHRPHPRR